MTFSPSALMRIRIIVSSWNNLLVSFVDVTTVWVHFVHTAYGFHGQDPSLQVVVEASVSKEATMTEGTGLLRFGKLTTRKGSFSL